MQLLYIKTSFQYKVNYIINDNFGFSFENEDDIGRKLRDFKKLNEIRRLTCREGQSNKIYRRSQILSVRCRVHKGESFSLS